MPGRFELVRREEEYDVGAPYQDLPDAERLVELTDRYQLAADEDQWGDKLDAFLRRAILAQAVD